MNKIRVWYIVLAVAFCLAPPGTSISAQNRGDDSVAAELKWRVERLRTAGQLQIGESIISRRELTLEVYEQRGFVPLWKESGALDGLLAAIESSWDDGLVPEHYHRAALARSRDVAGASELAQRDLLATDAFVRLSHDLRFGKVKPDGPASSHEDAWPYGEADRVARLEAVARSGNVREAVAALRPDHYVYRGLLAHLSALRQLKRQLEPGGNWPTIPAGPPMARDSVGERILLLRQRLGREAVDMHFDASVEEAVRSFQHRNGLSESGVVDEATLAALNIPLERRIEQVRTNMERARWVGHVLPDTFVVVNAAGARVYVVKGDSVRFESRVIVGTRYRQTPAFAAPMHYLDLNPTWTVPPGIVDEILGQVRRDGGYLKAQRMRVLDASGRAVDPGTIDFNQYTAATFPFVFRQDPGPMNALGRIKLMFPNSHRVYLHDTPARQLFAEEERLFSHGCVRVEDPVGLAVEVLGEPDVWNRQSLEAAIQTGKTRTIRLSKPIQVFVLYWTAAVDVDGQIHYYRDVYGRDAAILTALDR